MVCLMQVPFEFPEKMSFVPHEISRKKPLYLLDSFEGKIPSLLLVASRNIKDEGECCFTPDYFY